MRRADNIDKIVGDNVRALRISRGWSQSKLADAIGLTFQQVQKYEKGSNRVSAGRLYRIAKLFDVSIPSLYKGLEGPSGKGTSPLKLITTRGASRLMDAFSLITNRSTRYALVTLAESLAGKKS
jgi:transcriptional regulator with XRE-family HTH domain